MIHQHPFIRITASFALGIALGYYYPNGWIVVLLMVIAFSISILQKFERYHYNDHLCGLALCIACVAMGILTWITYPNPYSQELPKAGYYNAILLQDAVEKPKTFQCIAHLTDTAGTQYKTVLYIQKDSLASTLIEGSQIDVYLNRAQAQTFAYYNKKNIYSSAYGPTQRWHLTSQPDSTTFSAYAKRTKHHLLGVLQQHTDSSGYALTAAITLGQKSSLKGTTKQHFAASGASHLLAVSGLHVGIIFMAISLLFRPFKRYKNVQKWGQIIVILLLWMYAFLCGLPPSIIRAVTMFSIGALGIITGQQNYGINNVCFTAFIMLLYNPNYLLDMGFQLSFSAVIGILIYVESRRAASKTTNRLLTWVKEMCGISLVAQLATLPLILYYFGTFPTYFLLTNLVMIPLGTLLVYACLLLFILSPTPIASWLEWPITFLTSSMQTVTQFISTMPGAQLTNLHIGLFQAACLYALLFCLYRFYRDPTPKTLNATLICVVVWLFGDAVNRFI
ncbi:MAG: ComEC/Rec2 family competence protein [Paludibacteraceae bacterium]|nr:ComEC/Rec2 family competence protein [Paludibacteraceae bacterium]